MDIQFNNSVLTKNYNYTTLSNLSIVRFGADTATTDSSSMTSWQHTMSAYQCTIQLYAWSFANWSYINGQLKEGSTTQWQLNHTSGLSIPLKMQYYTYEVLDPTFSHNSSADTTTDNTTFVLNSLDKDGILANIEALFGSNYTVDSLYQARSDIPAALDDFAKGITYKMMSGPNATVAHGLVLENMTYIQVRWPWLILCAAMVILSTLFLVVTIVKSHTADILPWKSSLAPLILREQDFVWSDRHRGHRRISSVSN